MHEAHNSKPRRRFLLTLHLGADDRDEMIHALEEIALEMRSGHYNSSVTSGGYGSGFDLKVSEDPTVTHDSYFAAIRAKGYREESLAKVTHPVSEHGPGA